MRRTWFAAVVGSACVWQSSCTPANEVQAMGAGDDRPPPSATEAVGTATPEPVLRPAPPALSAGQMVRIEAGALLAGSPTGSEDRDPSREADALPLELSSFQIDRLPHPNDPSLPPTTGVTRAEAAAHCERSGKRLCHELEWERACSGPEAARFLTGDALDASACSAAPASCASSEGVHAMGVALREWTSSDVPKGFGNPSRTAVVRGADAGAKTASRRCAARDAATPESKDAALGFRCCRGEPQEASYPEERERPTTRPSKLDAAAQVEVLKGMPELAEYADGFTPFSRRDVDAALRRGDRSRSGIHYWSILAPSIYWSPVHGEELLVISGHVKQGALVAVLHVKPDGSHLHAASTVVAEADTSIALGVAEEHRQQLTWSTCFDCPGEGGAIVWGDDARVRFGFR